jgi:hypothetical protein
MIFKICLILGSAMVGYLFPDWIVVLSKKSVRIPIVHQIWSSLGIGLIITGLLFL